MPVDEPAETSPAPDGPAQGLGTAVREARLRRGTSLRGLAQQISVSPSTMSNIENAKVELSVSRLRAIAAALDCTVAELLGGGVPPGAESARPARHAAGLRTDVVERVADWRAYEPLPFDRVLRAAVRVFLAKGYHGASIRDVAQEAGMSVPGIYHHHASKQAMLREILEISVTDLLYRSQLARHEGADAVARFSNMVESVVLFHTHRRDVGFIAASEMRSLQRPFLDHFVAQRVEQQRMIDVEVEEAHAAGGFTVADPHLAARAVITMCTATAQWFDPLGPSTPSDIAASYVELARGMMGTSERGRVA